jgi:predicted transcriptional regulator
MKYRSRMDIAAAILEIALAPSRKTKIMYNAFLSFPQLKEYLGLLTDSGLLEHSKEESMYHTTEPGKRFLKMYKEIGGMMRPGRSLKTSVTA